jgi:hypothetical protein
MKIDLNEMKAEKCELNNEIEDLKSILSIKDLTMEKLKARTQSCNEQTEKYYGYFMNELGQEINLKDISELELSSKLSKVQDLCKQAIIQLKANHDKAQTNHQQEMMSTKQEYQEKIENLFKESYSHIQKLNEADSENYTLQNEIKSMKASNSTLNTTLNNFEDLACLTVPEVSSFESRINSLITKFDENLKLLQKYKFQNDEKANEIEKLAERNNSLRAENGIREQRIKNELDRSREELGVRTQQFEATEKVLLQSKQLLGRVLLLIIVDKKKEINDENAKSLQKMLYKLDQKQKLRSKERVKNPFTSVNSRYSPVR